jgi:hypothetical protein
MTVTHEHGEQRGNVVPQKESHFPSPIHELRHGEVEIGINAMPELDMDANATQNSHFRVRYLRELDVKYVVQQVKVGSIPIKASHRVTKVMICKIPKGVR